MSVSISAQYSKALDLHNRISAAAQLVQQNLWDMCRGLKEMRDGKLYKELGYQNFEEYCETEHGFSRQQAHKYISIIENVNRENVNPGLHLGVRKLYLLSTLSEPEQKKITAENDVESMTVKELEAQIRELKADNKRLSVTNDSTKTQLDIALKDYRRVNKEKLQLKDKVEDLENEIDDLRSRPIEATVTEQSDDVRQLKEEMDYLKKSYEQRQEQMKKASEQNRAETARLLSEQKERYEEKLRQVSSVPSKQDDKQVFKAYYTTAYDSFKRMVDFAKNSEDAAFCKDKISKLIERFTFLNEEA